MTIYRYVKSQRTTPASYLRLNFAWSGGFEKWAWLSIPGIFLHSGSNKIRLVAFGGRPAMGYRYL